MTVEATPAASTGTAPATEPVAAGTPAVVSQPAATPPAAAAPEAAPSSSAGTPPAAEVGLPEIKLPEGVEIDEKLLTSFREQARAAGLDSPKATALASWYAQQQAAAEKAVLDAVQQRDLAWVKELEADPTIGKAGMVEAQKALLKFGGQETADHLVRLGLANDPHMVRMLAKIGKGIAEDTTGVGPVGGGKPRALSRDERWSKLYDHPSSK